jgi:outer membrane lipoprotein LolB
MPAGLSPLRHPRKAAWRDAARLLAAVLALGLGGCASLPPPPASDGAVPQRQWRGRFAVFTPQEENRAAQSAAGRFALGCAESNCDLELISPLGNTIAVARNDSTGASLRTADGRSWRAPNADELTEQVLGWRVPLARLSDWLDGRVAQAVTAQGERLDTEAQALAEGRAPPVGGTDSGWLVRFEQWREGLPHRLSLIYPEHVRLRLIIDER